MMTWAMPCTSHLVNPATRHAIYYVARCCQVVTPPSHARERSSMQRSTVARFCSSASACLADPDNTTYLRSLRAPQYARVFLGNT
jgi:hypothetical protein